MTLVDAWLLFSSSCRTVDLSLDPLSKPLRIKAVRVIPVSIHKAPPVPRRESLSRGKDSRRHSNYLATLEILLGLFLQPEV